MPSCVSPQQQLQAAASVPSNNLPQSLQQSTLLWHTHMYKSVFYNTRMCACALALLLNFKAP